MSTAIQYGPSNRHLINGDVAFLSDPVKAALLSAYTPDQTHETWADVLAAGTEAAGSGYTARGLAVVNKTIVTVGLVTTLDSDDASWTTAGGGTLSAAFLVFYEDSGTDATSYLLSYVDFGGTSTATNGQILTVTVPGIISISAA